MIFICGPNNSRYSYTGTRCPHLDLAINSTATTVAEAITEYQQHFGVNVTPMIESFDGQPESAGRYWLHTDPQTQRSQAVRICIVRAGDNLSVMHDIDVTLQADDIVELQELIGAAAQAVNARDA